MKKIIFTFLVLLNFSNVFGVETKSDEQRKFNLLGSGEIFTLSPVMDSILLGTGVGLSGTMFLCDTVFETGHEEFSGNLDSKDDVPFFDRAFMTGYSKGLDVTSTVMEVSMLAAPVALFGFSIPKEEWFTVGVMYAESVLLANGIKEALKLSVHRTRPYMYYDGVPSDDLKSGRWQESFPSGHSTLCFTAAAFSTYVYAKYNPSGSGKYIVGGVSYGLAAATGILRIASGSHYLSDVLTGAAIGTVCGIGVPFLHTILPSKKDSRGNGFEMGPAGVSFNFTF